MLHPHLPKKGEEFCKFQIGVKTKIAWSKKKKNVILRK